MNTYVYRVFRIRIDDTVFVQAFRKTNHNLVTDGYLKAFKSEVRQRNLPIRKLIQNIRTVFLVEGFELQDAVGLEAVGVRILQKNEEV